jgi:hypothetical protein
MCAFLIVNKPFQTNLGQRRGWGRQQALVSHCKRGNDSLVRFNIKTREFSKHSNNPIRIIPVVHVAELFTALSYEFL